MKIRVECRATVEFDVKVTAKQKRQLEAGQITLDHIVDESDAYHALATGGDFEFVDWDEIQPKKAKRS